MEDVLECYALPVQVDEAVVCVDERPCQLLADTRPALLPKVGQTARYAFEYERHGVCNLFMLFQPGAAWRTTQVTAHRKQADFAFLMRDLVDGYYPNARLIRVVMDNLNIHSPASPAEARRLLRKLEFHFTPKHGSWLNMVEIELAVLVRQCLGQRLPDMATLQREVTAWQDHRNAQHATVHWQFSVEKARTKLARLYPLSSMR